MYHFSDQGGIEIFHPRPPLAHPESEPMVYAIDEWHQPLYFFPRDCPRVGVWPVETTSEEDRAWFAAQGGQRMILYLDAAWAEVHARAELWRYEFTSGGFEDCRDHGCWASRASERPIRRERLSNLPQMIENAGCRLVVTDLRATAHELWPATTLHVSMIRMRNLAGWQGPAGTPATPPC